MLPYAFLAGVGGWAGKLFTLNDFALCCLLLEFSSER